MLQVYVGGVEGFMAESNDELIENVEVTNGAWGIVLLLVLYPSGTDLRIRIPTVRREEERLGASRVGKTLEDMGKPP